MFECKVLANSLNARSLKTDTILMLKVRQVQWNVRHVQWNVRQVQWNVRQAHHFLMWNVRHVQILSHVECQTGTVECQTCATLSHVKCQTCVTLLCGCQTGATLYMPLQFIHDI